MLGRGPRRTWAAGVLLALVIVAGIAPVATAHEFVKEDRDDTRGPLDLASVTTSHPDDPGGVAFTLRTYRSWSSRSLNPDRARYFAVALDTDMQRNDDRVYERCAFVYYQRQLRAILTNCRHRRLESLLRLRPDDTSVEIFLSHGDVGFTHQWAAFSYYGDGPCARTCVDSVPNQLPLILHDLIAPRVTVMSPAQGLITDHSATNTVPVQFSAMDDDGGSGVATWDLQRAFFGNDWITIDTGSGGGDQTAMLTVPEGRRVQYRVTAVDLHENIDPSGSYSLAAPFDDDDEAATYSGTHSEVQNSHAYQGSYHVLGVDGKLTYPISAELGHLTLIGNGSGDWRIRVVVTRDLGGAIQLDQTIDSSVVQDGWRWVIFASGAATLFCPCTARVRVTQGSGASVDGILTNG